MDYKVILRPLALADLEAIVRYAAGRLGTCLLDQAETLCRLPHRGGPVRRRTGAKAMADGRDKMSAILKLTRFFAQ